MASFDEEKARTYLAGRFEELRAGSDQDIVSKLDEVGEDDLISSLVDHGGMVRKRFAQINRITLHNDEIRPVIITAWKALRSEQKRLALI